MNKLRFNGNSQHQEDVAVNENGQIVSLPESSSLDEQDRLSMRPEVYITDIIFNDDSILKVNKDDIVVFVGQNNVGKSQILKDLRRLVRDGFGAIVVKSISFKKDTPAIIKKWLSNITWSDEPKEADEYHGLNFNMGGAEMDLALKNANKLGRLCDAFMCMLHTWDRLRISDPQDAIMRKRPPEHPIHVLVKREDVRKKISEYFKRAFGYSLMPFIGFGEKIPLCVGEEPAIDKIIATSGTDMVAQYAEILDDYPQLQNQGDGMRSFAGLMLYLLLDIYNVFLIDEPEAFLHPPQAVLIGNIVGELLLQEQQAFVSTHSIHFINGLLDKAPDRVKVVRVTRSNNSNSFSVLDNAQLLQISKDPFLRYSALLEGMFYKNVVLCEGDADCMFYSMLNSAVDMKGAKGTETLFTHCGGKQRMAKVIGALKELKVDVKVIPDFDVLNNEGILKELVQACGGDWGQIERDYNVLVSDIKQRTNVGETGADILNKITAELSDVMGKVVSQTKMRNIREMLSSNTEWDRLKETGVSGIGAGNPCQSCKAVLSYLATIGIHVVQCGELERFVPTAGGHGPDWLHNVLDKYTEVSDPVYNAAKDFIRSWRL